MSSRTAGGANSRHSIPTPAAVSRTTKAASRTERPPVSPSSANVTCTGPRGGPRPRVRTKAPLALTFSSEPVTGEVEPQCSSTLRDTATRSPQRCSMTALPHDVA